MFEIASQIVICLILAALLGFIVGYLLGKSTCSEEVECETVATETTQSTKPASTTAPAEVLSTVEEEENDVGDKPLLLSEAREGGKDNLTRIKGIGVKIDQTLNDLGIYHFDQIASWTDEQAAWVDSQTAFPGRVQREKWVLQAKELAKGIETEFSKRVDKGEVASSKKA